MAKNLVNFKFDFSGLLIFQNIAILSVASGIAYGIVVV